jgi:hypothetical protein
MIDREVLINQIRETFADTQYPGDGFLQGSFEGCEPFEEIAPFKGRTERFGLEAAFLDAHYTALAFFSEGALRFFLPAYLIADLNDELHTADPVFHLTHGFYTSTVQMPVAGKMLTRRSGGSVLLNPRRYGAMTFGDSARHRLSVFTREEAAVIVMYLQHRRENDHENLDTDAINAALSGFWLGRAREAPSSQSLLQQLQQEGEFYSHINALK